MSKFSVKKPLTVIVAVIMIIALGIVSVLKMTPDLLPSIDLPYIVVMTTYLGATPKEVEEQVTKPLEKSLATIENLKSIQSNSSADFSVILMEFENGSSMDTASVETLQNVDLVEGSWGEDIGSPIIMKINPTMIPIMVASVDMEGYETERLSEFLNKTIIPELEGTTGVASIQAGGLVESEINVFINEDKIEKLNNKLIAKINSEMSSARVKIDKGLKEIRKAESKLDKQKTEFEKQKSETYDELSATLTELDSGVATAVANAEDAMAAAQLPELKAGYQAAERGTYDAIENFRDAEGELTKAEKKLKSAKNDLLNARAGLDRRANEALKKANLGSLITIDMVSGLLKGQNFDMPAGYIQKGKAKYLVSVGDKLSSRKQIKNLFLFNVEGLGDIQIKDVCDVVTTDNSKEVYASIDGKPSVVLTFSKQSNYETTVVSNNIKDRFEKLKDEYEGLNFTALMDQGKYIYLIIEAILSSLLYGALFAVLVLLLFLRDFKPTFITLLSIPVSLTFAIVLMYFSGVTINLISLSGLAVAVGMLVDNSIVVIENIFRLRKLGIDPKRAAVAGTKEVAAAITSSTLTTVCVFAPILFITGITRQLFSDMALTITYSLAASLIIALTLVPALAANMLSKKPKPEPQGALNFIETYKRVLNWNLNHKFLVLFISAALLAVTIHGSLAKGLILFPDMSTPMMSGQLTMDDKDSSVEKTAKTTDEVLDIIVNDVKGVKSAGALLESSDMGNITGETESGIVSLYVIVDTDAGLSGAEIEKKIELATLGLGCKVDIISSSSVTEYTSALYGSGVTVEVYSNDRANLEDSAKNIASVLSKVEGIEKVETGLKDAEPEYHFVIKKTKAMREGLTIAQIYMKVSEALTYEKVSTTVRIGSVDYDIVVSNGDEKTVKLNDLKNLEIADGVKLKDVATLEKTSSLPSINRLDQKTYISVTSELEEGYNITQVAEKCRDALEKEDFPDDVSYKFSGENESIEEAMKDLLEMMLLGILLVYLIMVAQFQSLRSPFIVMFTIPLAFTGGLGALLIFDKEISVMAMLGLIILNGVVVNNGIVLVDYINRLRAKGHNKRAAIILSGATRTRPVLMTSITTILGLVVMAIGKTAGTDMMQPIALVCIGGLIYATALTLLVVPVIYDIFTGEKFRYVKDKDIDVSDLILE